MATYLLAWNPKRWQWDDLSECIREVNEAGYTSIRWSCGRTRKIQSGDRLFLLRQGIEPRGILASGYAASDVFEAGHWDDNIRARGQTTLYVGASFDVLFDPDHEVVQAARCNPRPRPPLHD